MNDRPSKSCPLPDSARVADDPRAGVVGSFWRRLLRGGQWNWIDERFRAALPADIAARVMTLESRDRYHAKQGRSTARVVFHA